jgi:hypothetical protein
MRIEATKLIYSKLRFMLLTKTSGGLLFEFFLFSTNKHSEKYVPNLSGTVWETDYFEYQKGGSAYRFNGMEEIRTANQNDTLEFRPNGLLYSTFVGRGIWAQTGNKVFITYKTGDELIHDEYILKGNTLTYTERGTLSGNINFVVSIRYTKRGR